MSVDRELIFDLGMHRGRDTEFYLRKGFRVIAVEASPIMADAAAQSLASYLASGQLKIIQRALWSEDDDEISFYLNSEKDDWSSAVKNWAEKGGHQVNEIKVKTTTLPQLFDEHGTPYYIKCDIEGADRIFVRQLHADERRPFFVSVEAISLELLALLFAAGFDRAQIVNQAFNGLVKPPNPSREGIFADVQFNGFTSGLFGRELDPKNWIGFTEAARSYLDFVALNARSKTLAHGWLDFHVALPEALQ